MNTNNNELKLIQDFQRTDITIDPPPASFEAILMPYGVVIGDSMLTKEAAEKFVAHPKERIWSYASAQYRLARAELRPRDEQRGDIVGVFERERMSKWSELTSDERNRLVATQIMGWTPESRCEITEEDMEPLWQDDVYYRCKRCSHIDWIDRMQSHATAILSYSENLDVASEILKRLVLRVVVFEVIFTEDWGGNALLWKCTLQFLDGEERFSAVTKYPTQSLCLAALRACKVEIED